MIRMKNISGENASENSKFWLEHFMEETKPVVPEKYELECRDQSKSKSLFVSFGQSGVRCRVINPRFFSIDASFSVFLLSVEILGWKKQPVSTDKKICLNFGFSSKF